MLHMPKLLWVERFADRLAELAAGTAYCESALFVAELLYPQASDLAPELTAENYFDQEVRSLPQSLSQIR